MQRSRERARKMCHTQERQGVPPRSFVRTRSLVLARENAANYTHAAARMP